MFDFNLCPSKTPECGQEVKKGITHASSQQSQNIDDPRDAQDIMGGLRLCITSA
jgi:hypothetical protein